MPRSGFQRKWACLYMAAQFLPMFDLLKSERTYASANPYGTVHESHVDYDENSQGGITIMYYLNNFWYEF